MNNGFQAVFAITAIAMVAIGAIGLMNIGPYQLADFGEELPFEAETQTRTAFDVFGLATKGSGTFPGVEDPSEDELFHRQTYIMTWTDTGSSQDIFISSKITEGGFSRNFRFCFAIKTVGGLPFQKDITAGPGKGARAGEETERNVWYNIDGFNVMEEIDANGCFNFEESTSPGVGFLEDPVILSPHITQIDGAGIPHGSILRISFEMFSRSFFFEAFRWEQIAQDEALLQTGLGKITKDRVGNYEVGETAIITVTIPYIETEDGFGFFLDAFHIGLNEFVERDDGTLIQRLTVTDTTEIFRIPIESRFFTNGSFLNKIQLKLFNELFPKDAQRVEVVDIREKAPPKPEVQQDKIEYLEGDTITLTWQCQRNAQTNLPIAQAEVIAWIGGVEVFQDIISGENQNSTVSFTAPIAGILNYRVSCTDTAGRGTGDDGLVVIRNVRQTDFCTTNPTHPSCIPPPLLIPIVEILLLILAFIGAILLVVAFAFIGSTFNVPPQFILIGSIVIFVILALAIVILGAGAIETIQIWLAQG